MLKIDNIWIESEIKSPIIGGQSVYNDNSDAIVTTENGDRYVATFFTYQNIEHLRKKNQETGELLNGKYFCATDIIIIDKIERESITDVIQDLITNDVFRQYFRKL